MADILLSELLSRASCGKVDRCKSWFLLRYRSCMFAEVPHGVEMISAAIPQKPRAKFQIKSFESNSGIVRMPDHLIGSGSARGKITAAKRPLRPNGK